MQKGTVGDELMGDLEDDDRGLWSDEDVENENEIENEFYDGDEDLAQRLNVIGSQTQEDDEEVVEDDGEGDDDDEYQLEFDGGMDPFEFAEEDASGKLPFEQFQKLEYEALAVRKRKFKNTTNKGKQNDVFGASVDEIWDAAGYGIGGGHRRRKKRKKLGRPKRSKLTPEIRKKLGEANLLYATGKFDDAVKLLKEVVRVAPNVPDSYHTLGLLYDAMSDRKKALNFYMIAAHLTPKDTALWKRLASWSMEQGNTGQVIYCLTKAIKADPGDVDAKWDRASLYAELNENQKAAEAFEQILVQRPSDVEVCKMVAKIHHKMGQCDRAIHVLENLILEYPTEADLTAVNLLAELHMESGAFLSAITRIQNAHSMLCSGQSLPIDLAVKAGISHAYLGNVDDAERYFGDLTVERVEGFADLVMDVGDAYLALGEHKRALHYYIMLQGVKNFDNAALHLKMAQCHAALDEDLAAIDLYHKVLNDIPEHVEARLTLSSLLRKNGKNHEAVSILVPQASKHIVTQRDSEEKQAWWEEGKVKKKLAEIYYSQGEFQSFLDTILPVIQGTLFLESLHHKGKNLNSKKLRKSVLLERVKWLGEKPADEVFHGFRPMLSSSDMVKAARARKRLAEMTAQKEEKKAAALAAGVEYEDSDTELEPLKPPLPNLLKDEEHCRLLLQTCKVLASMQKYREATEIIHLSLRVGHGLTNEQRDDLRNISARIAYKTRDAQYAFSCVRYMVLRKPYCSSVWNSYYQVISRSEARVSRHHKFMLQMRSKYPDCIPPMIICGHQFNFISQPQGALREYLHAYKLQPEDPFINLCIGLSFINLSLGFRLTNRNQCILQGFAFLYSYQRLSKNSQESNYNLARAYHHVGLVQLAVHYYEKVLCRYERDHPVVKLAHEDADFVGSRNTGNEPVKKVGTILGSGHCDLRREAAYNLHHIYRKSGEMGLARQILKDYCTF